MSPVGAVAHGLGTVLHQLLVQGRRYTCVVAAISMSEIQMIYTRKVGRRQNCCTLSQIV